MIKKIFANIILLIVFLYLWNMNGNHRLLRLLAKLPGSQQCFVDHSPAQVSEDSETHKIWAHACNGPEKLRKASRFYKGFEFDLQIDTQANILLNKHDWDGISSSTLQETFVALPSSKNLSGIWLDIKNLSLANVDQAHRLFSELALDYKLSGGQIWIESPNFEALSVLATKGWQTSCYLTEDGLDEQIHRCRQYPLIKAVSFRSAIYPKVKEAEIKDKVLLSWMGSLPWWAILLAGDGKEILSDKNIQVLLGRSF